MKKLDFIYDVNECEIFFCSRLPENLKRLYVGLEAIRSGYYGVSEVSEKYGVHKHTIRTGKKEVLAKESVQAGHVRKSGGGRKKNGCRQQPD